jgi:DNA-binding NarL/FixJ family response regulator
MPGADPQRDSTLPTAGADGAITMVFLDPHAANRALTRRFLDEAGFDVVAEASTLGQARMAFAVTAPDVLVLELSLGEGRYAQHHLEALMRLAPTMKILILTVDYQPAFIRAALDRGVSGWLQKTAAAEELASAVCTVATGRFL